MTRRDGHLLTLFFILPAAMFFFPFLLGRTPYAGDLLYSFHPWLGFATENIQAGRFPLWNPYSACGENFSGNPSAMLYFPAAVFFRFLPFAAAERLFLLFNQGLLFLAAFLLGRFLFPRAKNRGGVLLSALAITWGGFAAVMWEFPPAGATLPFVLFSLLLGLARRWRLAAVSVALLFFAGYTPFSLYALLFGTLAVVWRSAAKKDWSVPFFWFLAVGVGLTLALVQILPSWEAARQSLRSLIGPAEARQHLLTPVFFIKFLVPDIFDKVALAFSPAVFDQALWPVQRNWLNTYFLGTAPLLLGLAGLAGLRKSRVKMLALLLLAALALATGLEPFFSLFRRLPGLAYMTHFSNLMLFAVLALSFLSIEGFSAPRKTAGTLWVLMMGAALLLAVSTEARRKILEALLGLASLTPAQHRHVTAAALKSALALLLCGGTLLLPLRIRTLGLVLLTAGELWAFGRDLHPLADARFFHRPVKLAGLVGDPSWRLAVAPQTLLEPAALSGASLEEGVQNLRQTLRPNVNMLFHVKSPWGYELSPRMVTSEFRRTIPIASPAGPPLNFLGIKYLFTRHPLPPPARAWLESPQGAVYMNGGACPLVQWVAESRAIPGKAERLRYLSSRWKPDKEVILERDAGRGMRDEAGKPGHSKFPVLAWREEPGKLEVRGESDRGWLVWSEVFDKGWEAYVNGKRAELRRANHAFQSVEIPGGKWEALFLFRPRAFRAGLLLSVAGLAGLAALSLIKRKEHIS